MRGRLRLFFGDRDSCFLSDFSRLRRSSGLDDLTRKERSMDPHERPVVTEENKVALRAGSTGHHVRYVLIASCALVILAFIIIALFIRP
jgi:Flp pilus assembly protein TadB